jgi:3-hydroxyisobutyrate dehydrogenase-like beta-hydroxyacid dehydrogenase
MGSVQRTDRTDVTQHNTLSLAFLGFGEVGQRFARDLSGRDGIRLAAFDSAHADVRRGPELAAAADRLGVAWARSAPDAGRAADIVISAVTADATEAVAEDAARWLGSAQTYVDLNSAAPQTKQRAAAAVERAGARYVEVAVMAAVLAPGIRVPMLAGGPAAEETSHRLAGLGMNMTVVSATVGHASAIKLCRSIVIKGLEALMVDCAAATRRFDVADEVYASLRKTYPAIDWAALAIDMGERVATHGVRRSAEMHEAAAMLHEAGINADLAEAVADAQARGARAKTGASRR